MAPPTARQLAALAVEGPDLALRGVVSGYGSFGVTSVGGPRPVLVAPGRGNPGEGNPPLQVWVDGARVRIQTPDGRPRVLADAEHVWDFGEADVPLRWPRSALHLVGPIGSLLRRISPAEVLTGRFSRPVATPAATVFGGRDAWVQHYLEPTPIARPLRGANPVAEVEGEIDLVLDAETGWPLRIQGSTWWGQWDEFTLGRDPAAPDTTWTGPLHTRPSDPPYDVERYRVQAAARNAAGLEWFADRIGTGRVAQTEVAFVVRVQSIQEVDPTTGALQATLALDLEDRAPVTLQVARWPRGEELRDHDWRATAFRWSTGPFDWAGEWGFRDLGPACLRAVAELLSQTPEVTR